jgi:hypothetical protein
MASLSSGSGSFCGTTRSLGESGLARTTCFQLGVGFDRGEFTGGSSGSMKRHRLKADRSPGTITGIAEATAERVRLGGELLQALANAVAANEKTQQKFRFVVLSRLATIETVVKMIHGGQIATRPWEPGLEEKIESHAKAAEEYIPRGSEELGQAMVKYIYGEQQEQGPRRGKGRAGSDWEI